MSVTGRALSAGATLTSAWGRTRVGAFLGQPVSWVFLAVSAVLGFLSLYPTFFLFYGSLTDSPLGVPGNFTLQNYVRAYGDPEAYPLLLNSFVFGLGAAGLSVAFALTLAWITIRTNAPFRKIFELTAIVPNILPPILVSISWVMLLNPSNGLINGALVALLGVEKGPFNVYSLPGLIFVEALILTPLAFLIVAAALKSMDPSLEESAKTLGSGELGVARRITFPLIRPAILAAATLNFVRAVESFDTPAIIALPARIEVFTTKIWREALGSFPTNHNLAAAYGVGILGIALVFVHLYRRFTSQVESFSTVTGKGFRPHQIDLGPWKYAASAVAFLLLVLLVVLPTLVLLLVALLPYYHVPTWQTWQNLTLDHFRYIWETPRVHKAFINSLFLALVGATVCMVLSALTSYLTVRTRIAARGVLEGLVFIPWAFPGTALALGLLWAYVDFPIPIYATLWIIMIAYVTRFLPYGLRAVTSTIIQIHRELEEASIVCGAGFLATFRRVLVPMMRPGVLAGWIILVTIFMREFSATLFLYSPGSEPLGPLLYFLYLDGMRGRVAAIGLVISAISVVLIAIAQRYSRWDSK
ncbi:MAG TPA: iron ABC transporter permease [candidate division Zixibacteria bacterium]|nr:iron ABC transporter permease [candidate division Zixibacteria bacterium]